jgi:DNA-binding PadR family transcriptional regulator
MAKPGRRVKRTYNLKPATVETVRRLVEAEVAPTQDALVERAVHDLDREIRDREHTRLWAEAGRDPEFRAEMEEVWAGFAADDRRAWEANEG